jgi:hypothetical protein
MKDKEIEDLFVDPEGIVEDINIEDIEEQAKSASFALCRNLREVYFDEEFMKKNPRFKERLDVELESLRVLVKMRKSDEIAHDLCLRSIGMNTNNASLYKALSGIQSSMLSIQRQMDDTVKNINNLLKNVQLELNFDNNQQNNTQGQQEIPLDSNTTRGSKKFIEMMNQELKQEAQMEIRPEDLFADEEQENEQE